MSDRADATAICAEERERLFRSALLKLRPAEPGVFKRCSLHPTTFVGPHGCPFCWDEYRLQGMLRRTPFIHSLSQG
jgi:hypothetical protein